MGLKVIVGLSAHRPETPALEDLQPDFLPNPDH
jgi:hypothetical protein